MKKDKELKVYNVWCVCVCGAGVFEVEMYASRDLKYVFDVSYMCYS